MARKAARRKGNKQPLYATVYDELVERVRSGQWAPGQRIPNEFQIAAEQGVSQGTARKVVSRLAAENLVVRVQGLGTFVVDPTPEHFQFRFFNVFHANGKRIIPRSRSAKCKVGTASRSERVALGLHRNARVIRFQRLRMRGRRPFVTESICLPAEIFESLVVRAQRPDTLYDLFQRDYGVLIKRIEERITPTTADANTAAKLKIAPGTPLLRVERIAFALNGRPVELRVSFYHLHGAHYRAAAE
jgi:GntR family transcriptional regulator